MSKRERVAPYKQKGRKPNKKIEKNTSIETIKIDAAENMERIKIMSEQELADIKTAIAQNALELMRDLIKEMQKRIPQMNDEVLATSLLQVWDKSNGGAKK